MLVTSLFFRIFDRNGFQTSLDAAQRDLTSTKNANRKRWSAGNLSLLPYLRPKWLPYKPECSSTWFQLQQTTWIGKDEVLVTSLFCRICRIFDGNGFNTSLDAAQRVSAPTKNANRKRWSAGNLSLLPYLRREWLQYKTGCSSTCFSSNKERESEKMKCW